MNLMSSEHQPAVTQALSENKSIRSVIWNSLSQDIAIQYKTETKLIIPILHTTEVETKASQRRIDSKQSQWSGKYKLPQRYVDVMAKTRKSSQDESTRMWRKLYVLPLHWLCFEQTELRRQIPERNVVTFG